MLSSIDSKCENRSAILSDSHGNFENRRAILSDSHGNFENRSAILSDSHGNFENRSAILSDSHGNFENRRAILSDSHGNFENRSAILSDSHGNFENRRAILSDSHGNFENRRAILSDSHENVERFHEDIRRAEITRQKRLQQNLDGVRRWLIDICRSWKALESRSDFQKYESTRTVLGGKDEVYNVMLQHLFEEFGLFFTSSEKMGIGQEWTIQPKLIVDKQSQNKSRETPQVISSTLRDTLAAMSISD